MSWLTNSGDRKSLHFDSPCPSDNKLRPGLRWQQNLSQNWRRKKQRPDRSCKLGGIAIARIRKFPFSSNFTSDSIACNQVRAG